MNTRRVIRYIPVSDGDVLDLPNTAMPGVGRKGNSVGLPGTYAMTAPSWNAFERGHMIPGNLVSGDHIILGYQPAPLNPRARKPYQASGWLIVLVDESVARQPRRLNRGAKAVA